MALIVRLTRSILLLRKILVRAWLLGGASPDRRSSSQLSCCRFIASQVARRSSSILREDDPGSALSRSSDMIGVFLNRESDNASPTPVSLLTAAVRSRGLVASYAQNLAVRQSVGAGLRRYGVKLTANIHLRCAAVKVQMIQSLTFTPASGPCQDLFLHCH